jgi:hypothetical protein
MRRGLPPPPKKLEPPFRGLQFFMREAAGVERCDPSSAQDRRGENGGIPPFEGVSPFLRRVCGEKRAWTRASGREGGP